MALARVVPACDARGPNMTILAEPTDTTGHSVSWSLPNRGTTPSLSALPAGLGNRRGIDTVRLWGPIRDYVGRCSTFTRYIDDDGVVHDEFRSSNETMSTGGQLHIRLYNGQHVAVIEHCLPRLSRGHNAEPLPLPEAKAMIEHLHTEAADHVEWTVAPEQLRISRLDLATDFHIAPGFLSPLLHGLAQAPRARAGSPHLYYDRERGGAQTLTVGPDSRPWRASLYDKFAEMAARASKEKSPGPRARAKAHAQQHRGRVRFELQLFTKSLTREGIYTVDDLTAQHLREKPRHYFSRTGFDTQVGGWSKVQQVMSRLAATDDPHYKFFGPTLAMLMAEAAGHPQPTRHPATRQRYQELAGQWGLTSADVNDWQGPPLRLDFDSTTLCHDEDAAW